MNKMDDFSQIVQGTLTVIALQAEPGISKQKGRIVRELQERSEVELGNLNGYRSFWQRE
ncbi:hypothetical protein [Paenibacillus jilunlii]|uniref:hypothetical protein n=1 Tax=Paenibacillus jilunlii TaxID=682956 RepID=UPI000AF3235E|nr:hypothetical protein [Paenibacillus jilunlii]